MTLEQQEREWQSLEQDTDTIVAFVSSLDTLRLQIMNTAISEELSLRSQGKPCDRARLH
jgi:hypothetical protein